MRILLTTSAAPLYSPFYTTEKLMPLGVGYLISSLKKEGHKVYFIDNYLRPTRFLETDFLFKHHIEVVGIYTSTICFSDSLRMIHKLQRLRDQKKWKGKIIVGGPHTAVAPETIPEYVDYIVQGEGEKVLLEILSGQINKRIIRGERIIDLDSLPRPAWDYFVKLPYDSSIHWFPERPVFRMNTSRGCPFNCTFCSVKSIWGTQYTFFSAERIIDDILFLMKEYDVRGIYFREDNFTANRERTIKFCEGLLKKKISIKWGCETRIDTLDKDLIELMYAAGCRGYFIGVESGSQRILNFFKKGISIEQIYKVFEWCRKIGMRIDASFIIGVPTETRKERLKTLRFAEELKSDTTSISIGTFVGIPKSPLSQYTVENSLYEYIDSRGIVYLKGHNKRIDKLYKGDKILKIPPRREEKRIEKIIYGSDPIVSVIMVLCDSNLTYLRKSIESVLSQSFWDFEFIIIVDNECDEKIKKALREYRIRDFRIRIIENRRKLGFAKSLNKGLKIAKGEYIAMMDAEGISYKNRFERQVEFLDKNKDYALIGSFYKVIDEKGKVIKEIKLLESDKKIKKCFMDRNWFYYGSVMFRRECLKKIGFYNKGFIYPQDYELWFRLAQKFKVANISEYLFGARCEDDRFKREIEYIYKESHRKQSSLIYHRIAVKINKLIENIKDMVSQKKIIIYGAGTIAKIIFPHIYQKASEISVVDKNKDLVSKQFLNQTFILPIESIKDISFDLLLVTPLCEKEEILVFLNKILKKKDYKKIIFIEDLLLDLFYYTDSREIVQEDMGNLKIFL
jgi:radical SAM superfamily enzyme YgiQ (UPF0313 family)